MFSRAGGKRRSKRASLCSANTPEEGVSTRCPFRRAHLPHASSACCSRVVYDHHAFSVPMITLHYLNQSRALRVWWLLEELEVPYDVKRYQRDETTMLAPAELKRVHPLGKSPVIEDDGQVIAESGAIIEYLTGKYDKKGLVPPAGTPERLRYTFWLHYAEGSLMPPLLLKLVFNRLATGPSPWIVRPLLRVISRRVQESFVDPQVQLHLDYVEQELTRYRWFAGDQFTAADIQMGFPLLVAKSQKALDDRYPHIMDFLKRMRERPAYQRALEKSGGDEI